VRRGGREKWRRPNNGGGE